MLAQEGMEVSLLVKDFFDEPGAGGGGAAADGWPRRSEASGGGSITGVDFCPRMIFERVR